MSYCRMRRSLGSLYATFFDPWYSLIVHISPSVPKNLGDFAARLPHVLFILSTFSGLLLTSHTLSYLYLSFDPHTSPAPLPSTRVFATVQMISKPEKIIKVAYITDTHPHSITPALPSVPKPIN
ncbi:MAG: hypothetical protein M1835_007906, partial [Candelina submexicana]